jgi:acetyltransferase EpsM
MTGLMHVVIIGAGGHGAEVASHIRQAISNGWPGRLEGFLDDRQAVSGVSGLPVLGTVEGFCLPEEWSGNSCYITAAGDNRLRQRMVERVRERFHERLRPVTVIHPTACVGEMVEVGEGTLLAPQALVTTRVQIGRHSILNVKASLSHDVVTGDFCNINPGATICGNVTIGTGAYIGAGATIKERITIGDWCIIGAGAVVVRDVPPFVTSAGVPARVIKRHKATGQS